MNSWVIREGRKLPDPLEGSRLFRVGAWTVVLNAMTVGVTLITGILIARLLGPAGRGELTSAITPPQLIGWIFAIGCGQAVSFHHSRKPHDAPSLLSSWLILAAPLIIVAWMAGQLFIGFSLAAQPLQTLLLARAYMAMVSVVIVGEIVYGIMLADQEFILYKTLGLVQPVLTAGIFLALWRTQRFNAETAAIATAGPLILCLAFAMFRVLARYRLGKPSIDLGRTTAWYGFKAHGAVVSDLVNLRLDLVIIPAFLASSAVGAYAVASTAAGTIGAIVSGLAVVVLPVAARRGGNTAAVVRLAQVTILLGALFVIVAEIAAPYAVRLVYGPAFIASVPVIRLLLPGTALYALASIIRGGLYAANRPFAAALAYAVGMGITVIGLLAFLRSGGLTAAALVSTVTYGSVLLVSIFAFWRVSSVNPLRLLPTLDLVRSAKRRPTPVLIGNDVR